MTHGLPFKSRDQTVRANSHVDRHFLAAEGYLALEMPVHALAELNAITNPPDCFELHRLRGDVLCGLDRYGDAARHYATALRRSPSALSVLLSLSRCYQKLGELTRAIRLLEEAVIRHPDEPAVLFTLARQHLLAGRVDRALCWLTLAVSICPDVAEWAAGDTDFAALHQHAVFQRLSESAAQDKQP